MAPSIDDVLSEITSRLDAGVMPWRQPWTGGSTPSRPLRSTCEPFTGSNLLFLAMAAATRGFVSPYWFTFQQALAVGGCVRKGEKGSPALLYKTRVVGEPDPESDELDVRRYAKTYFVFNADQIDGLPSTFAAAPAFDPDLRVGVQDAAIEAIPARIEIGGAQAFYNRAADVIRLPPPEVFATPDDFRATKWHELAHWTGAVPRLNRAFGQRFGDQAYAFEELVAEFASVILGFELGVRPILLDGHASYIAHWAKILRARPNALMEAAGHAQKAVDHLLGYGRSAVTAEDNEVAIAA